MASRGAALRLLSFANVATTPRQGGHSAGIDHDRSQAHELPLATQRLDEHHGIVMDWARRGLE
jgi:hypothetical protein